jgi:hypothetical protein
VNGTILIVPLQDQYGWPLYISWIFLDRNSRRDAHNDVIEKNITCGQLQ